MGVDEVFSIKLMNTEIKKTGNKFFVLWKK